jgi:hypothetical protein
VMHQTLRVKESDQHYLDILPDLPRFLRPRWQRRLTLWRHLFCLRVVAINPWFIPCDNAWHEGGVIFGTFQQFAARCRTVFCLILCEKPGNKFCRTRVSLQDPASVSLGMCQMSWVHQ